MMIREMLIEGKRWYSAEDIWHTIKDKKAQFNQAFWGLINRSDIKPHFQKSDKDYFMKNSVYNSHTYICTINGFAELVKYFKYYQEIDYKVYEELENSYRQSSKAEEKIQLQDIDRNLVFEDGIAYVKLAYVRLWIHNITYYINRAKEKGEKITIKEFEIETSNANSSYKKPVQFIEYIHLSKVAKYTDTLKRVKIEQIVAQIRDNLRGKHVETAENAVMGVIKQYAGELLGMDFDSLKAENEQLKHELESAIDEIKELKEKLERYENFVDMFKKL